MEELTMRSVLMSMLLILSMVLVACGGGTQEPAAPAEEAPAEEAPAAEEPAAEEPAAEGDPEPATGPVAEFNVPLPEVFNADAASAYSGATLRFYGDAVGIGSDMDRAAAQHFSDATGITIEVLPRPQDATQYYSTIQRFFQAQSPEADVLMVDVIWPGAFAPHLYDVTEVFAEEAGQHYEGIIENNTVDGKLTALPWFGDFGMLFYRTDLLEKYGYDGPPATWDELEEIARTVQEGEREEGNENFTGFVWQGAAYEGLTCDLLEWVYSHGGGTMIENGEVTINNPQAVQALERAASWVGDISPEGVVSYREEDARNVFQGGNAMFMRNWPYAYAAGNSADSPIQGMFDVAPLPTANDGEPAGTVGGWQLAVSEYSPNKEAGVEFVRFMASPEMQKWRALVGSFVPTIPAVAEDPEVIEAMPFLENLADVVRVTRPSRETGEQYNEASTAMFQAANEALLGATDAQTALDQAAQRLQRIVR
ncbi:MAG: ABC transporter substrate-binding protein [Chloroflexaceae bacterium]|nr:ABC transporter substrate-binding protein [Chloroflexaceae bacterium]NJL34328.1 ABC transporter substrate-binding protein [Chloroflexaceae bacterium]